jgi:sugar lactone lactonase YvrE
MISLLCAGNLYATTVALVGGQGKTGHVDGNTYTKALFNTPSGMAEDSSGDLWVADTGNNCIRVISSPEASQSAGSTTLTYAPVVTNLIVKPIGVALDDFEDVYILDYGNGKNGNILEYDNYGDIVETNVMNLTNAASMAMDSSGNFYVTVNSNQILKITSPGVSNVVVTITNAGVSLKGLVVKQIGTYAGWLAVCDAGRNGIYLVNPANGMVITNAGFHGAGDFPNGTDISSSQDAQFNQPMDVAETGDGSLIVTDYGNNRVKVVKSSDGGVTNLYGVVTSYWVGPYPGFSSTLTPSKGTPEVVQTPDTVGGVSAREPDGVLFAADGTVFVTEAYYNIIREATANGLPLPPPPPPPAPTAPAGLSATGGYGQITLNWLSDANATNYDIERSNTSGSGYGIIATTAGTSFTDTNIQDGTTYYYVAQAIGVGGESPISAQVSAIPLFSPPPTIESVITNTISYQNGSVTLTWTVSAGATAYIVERTPNATNATVSAPTTTYVDNSGLINGNTYYYTIAAENGGGINPTNSPQVAVTLPLPPVTDPQIGWVTYPLNPSEDQFLSVFNPGSPAGNTFNNDVDLVIVEPLGTQIYFNTGNTTIVTNVPDPTASSTTAPAGYANNNTQSTVEANWAINGLIQPSPSGNLMIKAIGEQSGHPNSDIVAALFQFVVGQPQAIGTNAGQFTLTNITAGSDMYYTYAYNTNLPGYPSSTNPAAIGPITNGETLALNFPQGTTNLTFEAVGYRVNYAPSAVYTNYFASSNFMANTISFGFASGPGSSQFVASPGQTFILPVGLSMLASSPSIYGLQFNVTITNLSGPVVDPNTIEFFSLLGKPQANSGYYAPIPPYMFISTNQIPPNNVPDAFLYESNWYQSLKFIDTNNEALLGLGWLEIYGRTNLYNTLSQNLLTFPILEGNDPYPTSSQSIAGGYTFGIPTNAISGNVYQVQIGLPSATAYPGGLGGNPYGVAVGIVASVDTNLVGPGSINALKNVTIGQLKYLVGDVHPANWFNAGDFGSSNLDNLDVSRVFDAAVYGPNTPPVLSTGESDLFDAMDSCGNIGVLDGATGYYTNVNTYPYFTNVSYSIKNNTIYEDSNGDVVSSNSTPAGPFVQFFQVYATTYFLTVNEQYTNTYIMTNAASFVTTNIIPVPNLVNVPIQAGNTTLFSGNDTTINQIAFGDGVLDVCDVYVTFRRSLDTNNLLWFQRYWTNGVRVATANWAPTFMPAVQTKSGSGKIVNGTSSPSTTPTSITNTPLVNFVAGDFQATAGQTIQIPVTAAVFGSYPLRVAMLNLSVVPLDGSPTLTTPISFTPGGPLGSPFMTTSSGNDNYAAAWLNSTIAGISNNATIGTLGITIPANATSMSAYAIHFDHASGSPNGLASFQNHTLTGLITLSSRTNSSYGDGIPDSWRLRYFGTTNNLLSVSTADADGTGMNNWQKYVAGLNPVDSTSVLSPYYAGTDQGVAQSPQDSVIDWPSVFGVDYVIQRSPTLFPPAWTSISTNTGTGNYMEIHDSPANPNRFYRVLVP